MTTDRTDSDAPNEPAASGGERHDYLVFHISNEAFAVAATSLRQILEPPTIVPVPNTPPHLLGVINLRGEIVAVLDLRVAFHLGVAGTSEEERLLVLRDGRRSVAIVADAVVSIESLDKRFFEPVPSDLPELHRRTFQGQIKIGTTPSVSILEASAIFQLPQFAVNTKHGSRSHG